jgi:hypothetical protein
VPYKSRSGEKFLEGTPFLSVKIAETDGVPCYELKNRGAHNADGEIVAFTDSDVCPKPTWLSSIVEGMRSGAEVVVGLSLFQGRSFGPDMALMQVATSVSKGFIIGKSKGDEGGQPYPAVGFLAHNVAFRADTFRRHQYRTDLGRPCAPPLLYRSLTKAGVKIALQPRHRAVHQFSWRWWLVSYHFRLGYEVFLLRRLDTGYPNQWITQTKFLEPLVTMVWHVLLDIPRWFRFGRLLRISLKRCLALVPVVLTMSIAARGAEMVGMYATLLAPKPMKRWVESV